MKLIDLFNFKKKAPELKTVSFKNVITFRIPANWHEEQEAELSSYYATRPGSGTLRCHLLWGERSDLTFETPLELLLHSEDGASGRVSSLPIGDALLEYRLDVEEDGIPLQLYYWQIANMPTGALLRMAVFSFAVATSHATDASNQRALNILRQELPATVFSPVSDTSA